MTVKELRDALAGFPPDAEIEFPINVFTKRFPVLYAASPRSTKATVDYEFWVNQPDERSKVRIWIHLPEGFTISQRKK